jgi:LysM repeat protein
MKKQKIRFYAALLCSSMVFSLVSTPVSAAETGQLTNPPTSTEGPGSPESASGNEAAAILNGLYAALPVANGVKEVATAEELTAALADSSISGITLKGDIDIGSTLTVNRTVTLDLNGNVLKMTGRGSVIKVESGGNLTIQDSSSTSTPHNFNPCHKDSAWHIDMWKLDDSGSETVSGGVITGGSSDYAHNDGGGVLVNAGGTLTMTGGSIVGCSAIGLGGGVRLAYDSAIGKNSTFTMTGGSIIGCAAKNGGGVSISPGCTFTMGSGSEIRNCNAQSGGGGVGISALWNSNIIGRFIMNGGTIRTCTGLYSGGVDNSGSFIMSGGTIKASISTAPQYTSSGGVWNDNQFTMTGGTIGDPGNPNDASSVYNTSTQRVTLTIRDNAKIYTNVTNVGILNADGGEIAGTMTNDTNEYGSGTITGSEGASDSTEFQGKVTNNGTIRKGTFTSEVINESSGTINGGTFTGTVENKDGTISGGDFSKATLNGMLVITFEPNNGEPVITREVNWSKDGAALTAPASTNEGHSLEGWYYDNNGTETKWNFDMDTVKCTMTLKAKWTKNTTPIIPGNDTNNIVEQYKTDDSGSGEQTDLDVPAPVVKSTTSYLTYTVQAGDTLWKIARKYNCSITEIMAANSDRIKNPNRIHAGWQLKIPQSGVPITGGTPDAVLPENKKSGIYIVRQGDTLWKIARKYGCSVAEIISLNRELIRNPALIYSGWELKVPQN